MIVHMARVRELKNGARLTTTLCGRMNAKSDDGMNSAEARADVTCKFCLARLALFDRKGIKP